MSPPIRARELACYRIARFLLSLGLVAAGVLPGTARDIGGEPSPPAGAAQRSVEGHVAITVDAKSAERFAALALACVHKEYPNKISHVLNSDADVGAPRTLTPAFFGCYDWHSSVHGHWLLARLARTFPDAAFATPAREAL